MSNVLEGTPGTRAADPGIGAGVAETTLGVTGDESTPKPPARSSHPAALIDRAIEFVRRAAGEFSCGRVIDPYASFLQGIDRTWRIEAAGIIREIDRGRELPTDRDGLEVIVKTGQGTSEVQYHGNAATGEITSSNG